MGGPWDPMGPNEEFREGAAATEREVFEKSCYPSLSESEGLESKSIFPESQSYSTFTSVCKNCGAGGPLVTPPCNGVATTSRSESRHPPLKIFATEGQRNPQKASEAKMDQ